MPAIQRKDNQVVPLITSALTLTGSWVDLGTLVAEGPLLNVMDCQSITLWLKLDINSSLNFRVRMLATSSMASSDFYQLPVKTAGASTVLVEGELMELNDDVDQNIVISFPTVDQLPFVKFQVQVGTVGGTAGQLTAAGVSFKSNLPGVA